MENVNKNMLFIEHPFKPGVQVNVYPFFEKLREFNFECGEPNELFSPVAEWLTNHIKLVSVDMIGPAKESVTELDISNMFFGLYKLKEIFEGIQEIKT
jgi:hypothetical protein